jgi:hypothetical protein
MYAADAVIGARHAADVPADGRLAGCDLMGTVQQRTQRKPAMVIDTEIVRVAMPAARRLEVTLPRQRPIDLDAEPGRGRDPG